MKNIFFILILAVSFSSLQGCLSVETKEYSFKLKKDGTGTGTIRFINIMTDSKDSADIIETDYRDLIDNYLNGNKIESEYPLIKNVKKRLFNEDDQLVGELSFEFNDLRDMKFYKYGNDGPWCYHLGMSQMGFFGTNESYFSSNGDWGGETMPVVFWSGKEDEFTFKTTIKAPDNTTLSLINIWNEKDGK